MSPVRWVGVPDALGSRAVVAGRHEAAATAPAAQVRHVERKRVGQLGWTVLFEERRDEAFRLATRDHATAAGRDRHRAVPTQDLQLHRRTLHDHTHTHTHAHTHTRLTALCPGLPG